MGIAFTGTIIRKPNSPLYPIIQPTQVEIDSHFGAITADADASTVTFDLSVTDRHSVVLGGNRTLAVSNATVGQQFTLLLQNDSSARTPVWFSGITWIGSPYTAPTMPSTASAYLTATFLCIATNTYLGWWLGNSAA